MGNSDEVLIGSSVNVIGYPGVSEEKIYTSESIYAPTDPYVSLRKDVEPSLSKGYISYIRPIVGGYKTFQMDISTTGGNSGGPVLNDKGEVVGIATYGYSEYQGGNYNYAQRINDIKTKIAEKVDLPQKESITSSANLEESSKESASIFIFVIIGLVILSLLAVILTRKFGNKSSGKRSK